MSGLPDSELLSRLSALKDSELIYERGVYPQSSYIFRHALTREVVYGSILARRRGELHCQIANAIEAIHKDNLSEYYEILSEHCYHGGDFVRAANYAKRASRKAEKGASQTESPFISHLT